MKPAGADGVCLGPFVLDLTRRGLYRDGAKVHLTQKPFETLVYLVQHRDRTVHKQELLDHVWAGTAVTDGVLTQAVREIRRSLGDDADDPRFVLTIPREGYRFVGPVDGVPSAEEVAGSARPRSLRWVQWRISGGHLLAALAAAVGLLFVLVASQSLRMSSGEGGGRLERLSPVTPAEVSAVKPAFSPDGSQLAYVSDGDEQGVFDLFVTDAAGGAPRRVTRAANASGDLPTFTADGSALVFARFRTGAAGNRVPDLWRARLAGGEPVLFISGASGAGFSSDGKWVAYTRHTSKNGQALHCGPVAAIELHREIARRGFMPRWSPDGRWVAFSTSNPEGGQGELWIVSPDGASRRQLTRSPAQIYGLAWAGSDRVVFASDGTGAFHLWGVGLDGTPPRPLTSGVGDYFSPTIPAGSSRIAFAHLRLTSELRLVSLGPGATSRVLTQSDYHELPRLSPNGRMLASLVSRADVDPRVHVADLATGAARRLGNRPVSGFCWVDDDRLALLTVADGDVTDLAIVPIASGDPVLLTRIAGEASWVAVQRDLRRIAFVLDGDATSRVVVRDLDSGRDVALAEGRGLRAPRWSPDGRDVAWSASPQGAGSDLNGLWIGRPGVSPRRVATDGYGPVWTPDGRALYFSRYADVDGGAGVWRLDLSTGNSTHVTRAQRVDDFDVAGDLLVYAIASGRARVFTAALP